MANLVFDFLHNYHAGERRDSEPANTYQYDEGHVIEANLPQVITSCEIHYWIRGMEKAEAYVPESITPNADGTCKILGHVPNEYFRTNGELRVYIVVTDGDASITTYEGRIQVYPRSMPDDYVDDDPDNEATRVLTEAREAAATATAAAETCEEVLGSIPEDYSTLSDDVTQLKEEISHIGGLSEDIKQALLQIAEKVAYIDEDGQDYYDALNNALYPPADLVSISAVYTQSGTVYDTDTLDSLKSDLVVTAHMSDSTTRTVTDYVLSGTLAEGTSIVTVTYGGKTTTFNVTVTHATPTYVTDGLIAYWDGIDNTGSGHDGSAGKWTDLVNGYELTLRETTHTTWDTDAVVFDGNSAQGLYTNDVLWTPTEKATIEVVLEPLATGTQSVATIDEPTTGTSKLDCRRFSLFSDGTVSFKGASGYTYINPVSALTDIRKMTAEYTDFTVDSAYVNGTSVSLSDKTHSFTFSGTKQIRIGVETLGGGTNYPFTGKIHAIRVYNKQLTSQELAKNLSYDNTRFSLGLTL